MDQVDIFSYYPTNSQAIPPSTSAKSHKQKSVPNAISHFTPINDRNSTTKPIRDQKIQIPTIQRQSRTREKSKTSKTSMAPLLHADQRIRQRSLSREPQQPSSTTPKPGTETKKIVAFGRTTTVETKSANTSGASTSRQSSSHISNTEAVRLRSDVEGLKAKVAASEQIHKEVEKLKSTLKTLVAKNEENFKTVNQQLRGEIQKLRTDFDVLNTANSELTKRIGELETRLARIDTKENQSVTSKSQAKAPTIRSYQPQLKSQQATPQTVTSDQKKSDILYSCLPTDTNRQIQQINNEFRHHRRHTSRDRSSQAFRHNDSSNKRLDYTPNKSNDTSRRLRHMNLSGDKENRPMPQNTKKALASNQVIELNDTYDKDDDFAFNEG